MLQSREMDAWEMFGWKHWLLECHGFSYCWIVGCWLIHLLLGIVFQSLDKCVWFELFLHLVASSLVPTCGVTVFWLQGSWFVGSRSALGLVVSLSGDEHGGSGCMMLTIMVKTCTSQKKNKRMMSKSGNKSVM